jgi:hypothetical protein
LTQDAGLKARRYNGATQEPPFADSEWGTAEEKEKQVPRCARDDSLFLVAVYFWWQFIFGGSLFLVAVYFWRRLILGNRLADLKFGHYINPEAEKPKIQGGVIVPR